MSWPLSQDYNEAIQNPASSLGDPALRRGQPAVNDMGLPIPRSGNFADVYQFIDGDGKTWALKCFTRHVPGLAHRYAAVDRHLRDQHLPFMVGFRYLETGIRIRGNWYPLLQMEWVEGFTLNDFLRRHADKGAYLEALFLMWVRLAKRLRQADIAHGDLQHGNILLVPAVKAAKLELKLIDYDGMWVPELGKRPPGEFGHPAYQHPSRREGVYGPDVDRFSHLLIACGLRALLVGGSALWERFDNGDNLLFREEDIVQPAASPLVRSLGKIDDPILSPLLGQLVLAARRPLAESPWLDHLMASAETLALDAAQQREVAEVVGVEALQTEFVAEPIANGGAQEVFAALREADVIEDEPRTFRPAALLPWFIALGALVLGFLLLLLPAVLILYDRKPKAPEPPPATMPEQP